MQKSLRAWPLLTAGIVGAAVVGAAPARQVVESDLNGDGQVERIVLEPEQAQTLTVWRGERRLWSGVTRAWKPWKLTTGDADGDGNREIAVGLFKGTRYFPKPHNCLFLYSLKGDTVKKMWLGSSLSKPFTDFTFANLDRDKADELVALERLADGRWCAMVYSWNGFGFHGDRQLGRWKTARLAGRKGHAVLVMADGKEFRIRRLR